MNEKFIADRITQLRIKKDKSESEMSFDLNFSSSYVNMIARNKNMPSMSAFLTICEYFEVTPVQFFLPEMDADAEAMLMTYIGFSEDEKTVVKAVMEGIVARHCLAELQGRNRTQ